MPLASHPLCACRKDFPSLQQTLNGIPLAFLDGPAGTQVPRSVIDAVVAYYETSNANTHGTFVTSRRTDAMLHQAREAAAAFVGAPSWNTISFGANMTSLAFSVSHAIARQLEPGDEVVITQLEHEANRGPWLSLGERGAVVREVGLLPDGRLDLDDMQRKINAKTKLVAMGLSANVFGTVNDVATARNLSRSVGAWLALDAVHYAPHFPLDVVQLDADFLFCSAYKFYGPHVGILYCRQGLLEQLAVDRLLPQEQEAPWRVETGTLNHAALAGLEAALSYLARWGHGDTLRARLVTAMESISAYEHDLAAAYYDRVTQIPGVKAWGPDFASGPRAPTVSISIEGVTPQTAATQLAEEGVLVWDGHFYAVRPVEVLGLAEGGGVLRAGISMYNTQAELDRLVAGVARLASIGAPSRPGEPHHVDF